MLSKLKAARLQRKWTQTKLGGKADVHTSDVSKFETGRAQPYPGQAARLAKALKLRPEELLQPADTDA
jgi:transcriptional regulator with XRE-family HTH domain